MALFGNKNVYTPLTPATPPAAEDVPELDFLKERAAAKELPPAPAPAIPGNTPFSAVPDHTPAAPVFSAQPVNTAPTGLDFVDHPVIPAQAPSQAPSFIATPLAAPAAAAAPIPAAPALTPPPAPAYAAAPMPAMPAAAIPAASPAAPAIPVPAPVPAPAAEADVPYKHDTTLDDYEWELAEPAETKTAGTAREITPAPAAPIQSHISEPARPVGFVASPSATDAAIAKLGSAPPITIPGLSISKQYSPLVLSSANPPVITVARSGLSYIAKDSLRNLSAYGQDEYDALRELFRLAGREMTAFTRALPPMPE